MKPRGISSTWWVTRTSGGLVSSSASVAKPRHEVLAGAEVEAGGGLVEDEQLRIGHERARELHLLLLAARERAEHSSRERRHAEAVEQRRALARGLRRCRCATTPRAPRCRAVITTSTTSTSRRSIAAIDDAREADARPHLADVDLPEHCSEHAHVTRDGCRYSDDDAHERRLARAVRAEHDPSLAAPHLASRGRRARACRRTRR